MANKTKVKLILELRDAHMSQNSIAVSWNMAKSSASAVCRITDEKMIRYEDVRGLLEDEVYRMFSESSAGRLP